MALVEKQPALVEVFDGGHLKSSGCFLEPSWAAAVTVAVLVVVLACFAPGEKWERRWLENLYSVGSKAVVSVYTAASFPETVDYSSLLAFVVE